MSREDDARLYRQMFPDGEAKTVRTGFHQVPFWRCRERKGFGPWQALPSSEALRSMKDASMTQPHQIDREAVAEPGTPCALMGEAMARYKHDELTAGEAVSIILEQAKRLSPAPEAVAWREKAADAAYVVLRHVDYKPGTDNGLIPHGERLVPLAIADAILVLIQSERAG